MALWAAEVDRLLKNTRDTFGKPTIYQRPAINGRPAYPAFTITGVPEFLSRLPDVDRGEFFSAYYVLEDFEAATFAASVVATFSATIPPPDGGVLTIDGIGYTAKAALDNTVPFQFFRGTNGGTAAANLTAAINATDGYGGTAYSESTPPHPTCEAFNDSPSPQVRISYLDPGISGNGVTVQDAMGSLNFDSKIFYGGGPMKEDLITIDGILYRVSYEPSPDTNGGIQLRLEKKAL
jgi:hypothetical protein